SCCSRVPMLRRNSSCGVQTFGACANREVLNSTNASPDLTNRIVISLLRKHEIRKELTVFAFGCQLWASPDDTIPSVIGGNAMRCSRLTVSAGFLMGLALHAGPAMAASCESLA